MVYLFVDVGRRIDKLAEPQLTFAWSELSADAVTEEREEVPEFVMPLMDWIDAFLSKNTRVIVADTSHNRLLAEVLQLVVQLVSFGFYVAPDQVQPHHAGPRCYATLLSANECLA